MKIAILGPGLMPIPPTGWGAVEILVWDYYQTLVKLGYQVEIINTPNPNEMINLCNGGKFDFVHIQYEDYAPIAKYLSCPNVAVTSHFAYLEQPNKWGNGYRNIFYNTINAGSYILALSDGIKEIYESFGHDPEKIFVVPNGVRTDLFKFDENPLYPNRSIYLAKIDSTRKRQHLFQNIDSLFFAGKLDCTIYNGNNYLGEWDKNYLYENLTNYANLVLLSDGEAHPLVCLEALSAGLGLVISEYSTAHLNLDKDFITVIPESKINDLEYVEKKIQENREISVSKRKEIREYSKDFDWSKTIKDIYIPIVQEIIKNNV